MYDINEILIRGMEMKCSDIHISAGRPPMARVDGELVQIEGYDRVMPEDTEHLCRALMNDYHFEQFQKNGEVDMAYSLPGKGRFRVNVFKQRNTCAAAIRILETKLLSLEELKLPTVFKQLALMPTGLILVTGPTGGGKSTTLAAIIDYINRNRRGHILTIEDPVEYLHRHNNCIVNQREVGEDTAGFAPALRAALREDIDVILVGEMRDLETASIAMTAAETGHLVLSTLHTINAAQTVDRIIDMYPPHQQEQIRSQLAGCLRGIISQRLLKKLGDHGRIPAFDIMLMTDAMRNIVREGKTHQIPSTMQTGMAYGMVTMEYSLSELVKTGVISYSDAVANCVDKALLDRYIG